MARKVWMVLGLVALLAGLARAEGIRQSVLNKCPGDEEFVATAGKDSYKHKIKVNTLENKLDEVYPDSAWSLSNDQGYSLGETKTKFYIGRTDVHIRIDVPGEGWDFCNFTVVVLPRECKAPALRKFHILPNITYQYIGNGHDHSEPEFRGRPYIDNQTFLFRDYFMKMCNEADGYYSVNWTPSDPTPEYRLEFWVCMEIQEEAENEDEELPPPYYMWDRVFGNLTCGYCAGYGVFHCETTGDCISSDLRGNGVADCPNGEDEDGFLVTYETALVEDGDIHQMVHVPLWGHNGLMLPKCYAEIEATGFLNDQNNLDIMCQQLGFSENHGVHEVKKTSITSDNDGVLIEDENGDLVQLSSCESNKLLGLTCSNCPYGQFECHPDHCIDEEQRCNFILDCPDNIDEHGCINTEEVVMEIDGENVTITVPLWLEDNHFVPVCYEEIMDIHPSYLDLTCQYLGYGSALDVYEVRKADTIADQYGYVVINTTGVIDYYADGCPSSNKVAGIRCSPCLRNELYCASTGMCVERCDGEAQCPDGSDEYMCQSVTYVFDFDQDEYLAVPLWLDFYNNETYPACAKEFEDLDTAVLNEVCYALDLGQFAVSVERVGKNEVDASTDYFALYETLGENDYDVSFVSECPTNNKVAALVCSDCDPASEFECAVDAPMMCASNEDRCSMDCRNPDCYQMATVPAGDGTESFPMIYWAELDDFVLFCDMEDWRAAMSNTVCEMMGYSGRADHGSINKSNAGDYRNGYVQLSEDENGELQFEYRLKADGCDYNNKVRTLTCE